MAPNRIKARGGMSPGSMVRKRRNIAACLTRKGA